MRATVIQRIEALRPSATVALVCLLLAIVAGLDVATGEEVSFSLFYLAPVVVVTFRWGSRLGQGAAVAAAAVWFTIDHVSGAQYSHVLIPVWNAGVRFGFFSLVSALIGGLHAAVERETLLARTDALTGLPNRRAFLELASRELARAERHGSTVAVAVVDLDDFKSVNDRFGHEAGDEVLRGFAEIARATLRSVDITARTGGDEFAVILPDIDILGARQVLDRFRGVLASRPGGGIGCSIGVVCATGGDLDAALCAADEALYRAKRGGRSAIEFADVTAGLVRPDLA